MSIVGITRLDRINETKLRENYALIIGTSSVGLTVEECVRNLETHVEKKCAAENRVQCDVCAGWSDENLTACPYCNDEGPELRAEAEKQPDPEPETRLEEGTVIDATVIEASGVELQDEKPKGKKKDKKTAAEVAASKAPKPMPDMVKPSAPVIDVPLAPVVANEKELDASLERYRKASESTATGLYLMGVEIAKIHDHLWQQRVEGGKPKYKSWSQFVATELSISVPYANRLKQVAEKFSAEHFEKYGAKALMVMAAAPKEDHAQLMAKADEGATTRELQADVQRIRAEKGVKVVDEPTEGANGRGRQQTQKATQAAAAAREERARKESAAVTIGLKNETGKVKLFAKPLAEAAPHLKAVRAKSLDDQPYGKIEGINGVTLFLAVQTTPSGELEIRYTTQREEDE